MVQILPFCGFRYDLSQVGALFEVTAPPSYLIDETQQRNLYRLHPCNAVRLVMNRPEPGDASPLDQSTRADDFWRLWKRERVLLVEHEVAFYVIETTFSVSGTQQARWSVIARLRLPDGDPSGSPEMLSLVKADAESVRQQLELRTVCLAAFSPAIGLIEDTTGGDSDPRSLSDHLEFVVRQATPIECIDDVGNRHRLWPMTDQNAKTELEARLSQLSVCIIGGGAEYLAAIKHRDELLAAGHLDNPNDLAQSMLVCLVPTDDPGVQLLPRVQSLPGTAAMTLDQSVNLLSTELLCQFVGSEPTASDDAVELAKLSEIQPCVAIGAKDGSWMIVSPKATGDTSTLDGLANSVAALICGGSHGDVPMRVHRLPLNFTNLAGFVSPLTSAADIGLFIVQPPIEASNVVSLAAGGQLVSEDSLRLNPGVPSGLVFASLEHQ